MRGNGFCTFASERGVALERARARPARSVEDAADDLDQEVLGEVHVAVEVDERDLGLDHPELGQMAARLRLLGAEGRAEAVHLAERHRAGLHVELAGLREVGLVVEVVDLEQRRRALARVGREDRRVDQREAVRVEVVAAGADDARAHAQDRVLARRAQPEVAVVHQEVGAVLLRRDRVLVRLLHDAHVARRRARSRAASARRRARCRSPRATTPA